MSTNQMIMSFPNKHPMNKITVIVLFLLLGLGCQPEEEGVIIDELLQSYVDDFESEAEQRGLSITVETDMVVETITGDNTIGQCQAYSDGGTRIVIDAIRWKPLSPLKREYVIFHELGHCVLDRDHIALGDSCTSIMHEGESGCIDFYTLENRSAWLDELFE